MTARKKGGFITGLNERPGLRQLLVRSAWFFGILFGIYFLIFTWFRHTAFFVRHLRIEEGFYLPFLTGLSKTDVINSALFVVVAFVLWNRFRLLATAKTQRDVQETIVFGVLAAIAFVGHYALKYWVSGHEVTYPGLVVLAKYALLLLFVGFLALACYTKRFVREFLREYRLQLLIFIGIGLAYFFLIQLFQLVWYQLSTFVAVVIRFLLSLTFDSVFFSQGNVTTGPRLGAEGFRVGISSDCSGIDSLLLFLSLYGILLALDWNRLNRKRMFILLIPGLIGTVLYNILRIYLLILVGILIDPEFAVDVFHSNIGWILFLAFFMVFWHFGSKWVYQKK